MQYTNVCKHCYEVFRARIPTCTCRNCRRVNEALFDDIEKYLKLYPNSNALQISEELNVPAYTILKYMDEGRLLKSRGTFSRLPEEDSPMEKL